MKTVGAIFLCLILSTSGSTVAPPFYVGQMKDSQTNQLLQGNWGGGFMLDGNWVTLNMNFVSMDGGINGTSSIVFTGYESQIGLALTAISFRCLPD